ALEARRGSLLLSEGRSADVRRGEVHENQGTHVSVRNQRAGHGGVLSHGAGPGARAGAERVAHARGWLCRQGGLVTDGARQIASGGEGAGVSFRTGQAINPVERGHIAFRTDDIEAFKRRLTEIGIANSDFGTWAMKGWEQNDPGGNIEEAPGAQLRG